MKFNLNQMKELSLALEATTNRQIDVVQDFCKEYNNAEFDNVEKDTVFMFTSNPLTPVIRTTVERANAMGLTIVPFREQFERPFARISVPVKRRPGWGQE